MSQDEAALVIQKQFRGFQARKEYGPLISSEKMTNEMALVMKQYCRKWKAKSLFQVLLMYRAARHQDLVYMSQQVHLYNQNVVSSLQQLNRERVSLNNIDPDATPSKFIGRFMPRHWKLPFRLSDMPFCDSSYMVNTMGKRTLHKDDTPWDDPYKRRTRVISASGTTTDLENRGMPVEEGGDVFSFIQTPYTRDPSYIQVMYEGQPYRKGDHYFTSKSGKERRNSRKKLMAPAAPQFNNYNQPVNRPQSTDFGHSSGYVQPSYAKAASACSSPVRGYQPPRPNTNFVAPQSDYGNGNYRDNLKPAGGNQKRDAIKELEMKFKQVNNNYGENEEDAPTFNFQAMLRKTNHNRASLRRSPEMEMASNHGNRSFPSIPEQKSVKEPYNYRNNNNNIVYNSNNNAMKHKGGAAMGQRPMMRQDSGDCRKVMSHHYKESVRKAKDDEITTEIAPGIIIQGKVAEL